jgi:hypothetical protein
LDLVEAQEVIVAQREGFDEIKELPPSSRRQATLHRSVASDLFKSHQSQKEDHPMDGLLFGGVRGI